MSLIGVIEFSATLRDRFGSAEEIRHYLSQSSFDTADPRAMALQAMLMDLAHLARKDLDGLARAGVAKGPLFATGGWSRSTLLMQLRANVFGEPVLVVDEPELTGLGAALAALAAVTGQSPNFEPAQGIHTVMPRALQE